MPRAGAGEVERGGSGARDRLAEVFLERSIAALRRLAAAAPAALLEEALRAPTDVGGVASLLSDLAPLGVELESLDPWAEELARGVEVKQALLREAGRLLTVSEVRQILGGVSRQAVDQRARRNRLLALPLGSGERRFPAFQFTEDGVVAGFEDVLAAFAVQDPWTRLSLLLDTEAALGGRRVIDALHDGDLEAVVRVVAGFGG